MHQLHDKTNNALIGEISEQQFAFLQSQLEAESMDDHDYSITAMELDYFEGQNADPALMAMLRAALGEREEMIILWE